jgi:hypothetical protein
MNAVVTSNSSSNSLSPCKGPGKGLLLLISKKLLHLNLTYIVSMLVNVRNEITKTMRGNQLPVSDTM